MEKGRITKEQALSALYWLRQHISAAHGENKAADTLRSYINEREARIAELEQRPAVPQGWQPIETAPKDGSRILLIAKGGWVADGQWEKEAYAGNGAWVWPFVHREPTYWMPLPALLPAQPAEQQPTPDVAVLWENVGKGDPVDAANLALELQQFIEQQSARAAEALAIIRDIKSWDCDPERGLLSLPLELRQRMQAALAAHRKPSVAPCCGDPGDCWEPCGELGKSEAHVRVSDVSDLAPDNSGLRAVCQRHIEMISHGLNDFQPKQCPGNETSFVHLAWMLEQIPAMPTAKAHRWLGFVQACLCVAGLTTVEAERNATRELLREGGEA